jgi:ectoine hydroxylase-related dioxygenase (phytanoyl-CoA dioxygenase family)
MPAPTLKIPDRQLQQFRDEGYMILERVIPDDLLRIMRDECQRFIDRENALMDRNGTDVHGLSHRNNRYFVSNCFRDQPRLRECLFAPVMADVCRQTIGDEAYLFWEQYVVKGAEKGMKFSWHQDSGYVGYPDHKPYLTCWCPLDDVSEENGTVYVMPFSTIGIKSWVKHIREEGTNDLVGYFGKERGVPVIAPAGSLAVFSSLSFHSSGHNRTNQMRRVYLMQYSSEPVLTVDGQKLWGNAEPFLKGGGIVAAKENGPTAGSQLEDWEKYEKERHRGEATIAPQR